MQAFQLVEVESNSVELTTGYIGDLAKAEELVKKQAVEGKEVLQCVHATADFYCNK